METTKNTKVEDIKDNEPKKQKASATQVLRSSRNNANKLEELGLITKEESETIKEILKKAVTKYVGGGGQSVAGATADGASERGQLGIQLASQIALMNAQKENIEADTEQKKATTTKTGAETTATEFQNALNEKIGLQRMWDRYEWASDKLEIESQRANAEWEAFIAGGFKGKTFDNPESPLAKAITAGFEKAVTDLENAKKEGNILESEKAIKEFEAGLAKQGISPNTPWYVKMVADLLEKVGLNPITEIKK